MVSWGLLVILGVVLFAPFLVKKVEEELELFLFVMGCLALTVTSQWSLFLIKEALIEPIKITLTVFIAGFIFTVFQKPIARKVDKLSAILGLKLFAFLVIVILGILSSVITVIIATLLLVEIVTHLQLDRKNEVYLVILACFSIGMGAALTPIGEPLSAIAIAKLKTSPYQADFFFLFRHLGYCIIPAIIVFGLIAIIIMPNKLSEKQGFETVKVENIKDISVRTVKVYFFIVALIFLGKGFKPFISTYITKIPYTGLYWLNVISAVVDNATLTAAEIDGSLSLVQIKSALLGLLLAGGMLIPGNIPNIICAGKLKIKSSEWARIGVPLGLAVMTVYFFLLILIHKS